MNIFTIANYEWEDQPQYKVLAILWMNRMRKFHPDDSLWLGTSKPIKDKDIQAALERFQVGVILLNPTTELKIHHNLRWKLGGLCQFPEPFLFVDIDAIPLASLEPLWYHTNQPFAASNHQEIEGHSSPFYDFMNSGVLVVKDPSILNQEQLMKFLGDKFENNHRNIPISGADQALLHCYFKYIGYEWRSFLFTHRWNFWAGKALLKWDSQFGTNDWIAFDKDQKELRIQDQVKVIHYWHEAKPWTLKCPMYDLAKRSLGI